MYACKCKNGVRLVNCASKIFFRLQLIHVVDPLLFLVLEMRRKILEIGTMTGSV